MTKIDVILEKVFYKTSTVEQFVRGSKYAFKVWLTQNRQEIKESIDFRKETIASLKLTEIEMINKLLEDLNNE